MHLICLRLHADVRPEQFFVKQPSCDSLPVDALINVRRAQRGMAGRPASQQPKGKGAAAYGASLTA